MTQYKLVDSKNQLLQVGDRVIGSGINHHGEKGTVRTLYGRGIRVMFDRNNITYSTVASEWEKLTKEKDMSEK